MIVATQPKNEEERLKKLRELDVLDTPIEERFERITRMVCRTLDVPISAVSLIEEDRQWFKSIQGMDAIESPRDITFCSHAILSDEPLIIEDATKDDRFCENELVTGEPEIRFYAGIPLVVEDDIRIGTLCAVSTEVRQFDLEEMETLKDLAKMARMEILRSGVPTRQMEFVKNHKQYERVELIDPSTRCWNRLAAEKILEDEWDAAIEGDSSLSIAIIDVSLNRYAEGLSESMIFDFDQAEGDLVCQDLAKKLLILLEDEDVLCRWQNYRFLIVKPKHSAEMMQTESVKILQALRKASLLTGVNASLGVATLSPNSTSSMDSFIKEAEKACANVLENGGDSFEIKVA